MDFLRDSKHAMRLAWPLYDSFACDPRGATLERCERPWMYGCQRHDWILTRYSKSIVWCNIPTEVNPVLSCPVSRTDSHRGKSSSLVWWSEAMFEWWGCVRSWARFTVLYCSYPHHKETTAVGSVRPSVWWWWMESEKSSFPFRRFLGGRKEEKFGWWRSTICRCLHMSRISFDETRCCGCWKRMQ